MLYKLSIEVIGVVIGAVSSLLAVSVEYYFNLEVGIFATINLVDVEPNIVCLVKLEAVVTVEVVAANRIAQTRDIFLVKNLRWNMYRLLKVLGAWIGGSFTVSSSLVASLSCAGLLLFTLYHTCISNLSLSNKTGFHCTCGKSDNPRVPNSGKESTCLKKKQNSKEKEINK